MSKLSSSTLFTFDDYRPYVRTWVENRGRGEFRKLAIALKIHTTLVSQVFSGRKNFTGEQATQLASYMGLRKLSI